MKKWLIILFSCMSVYAWADNDDNTQNGQGDQGSGNQEEQTPKPDDAEETTDGEPIRQLIISRKDMDHTIYRSLYPDVSGYYTNKRIYLQIQPQPNEVDIAILDAGRMELYADVLVPHNGSCTILLNESWTGDYELEIRIGDGFYTGYFTIE